MRSLSFRVGDCGFRLETNSEALLTETTKDYSHFVSSTVQTPEGRIVLAETEGNFPIRVPEYAVRDSFGPNGSAIFTHSGRRYVMVRDDCAFEIDLHGKTIEGYFRPEYPVWSFFRPMLKWFVIKNLERTGLHFLHASAGVRSGSCVIFAAPSGFGKTSALLALLARGHRLVTDDLVFFDGKSVHPFHTRSMIHADMVERFPLLRRVLENPLTSEAEGGWHVDLETLFGGVHNPFEPDELLLVYLYVWNAPETRWKKLKRNQMVSKMCNSYLMELSNSFWFGWNREAVASDVFQSYFELSAMARSYEMRAGWDLGKFEESLFSIIERETS